MARWFLAALALMANATAALAVTGGPPRSGTDAVIIHAIGGPLQNCPHGRLEFSGAPGNAARWKAFFDHHPFLGIHYVIDRDGAIAASTPDNLRANHALGASETTIGIELVHNGDGIEPFPERQIEALVGLLRTLTGRYRLTVDDVKGHADVDGRTFACGGKVYKGRMDPGANFPWQRVRDALSAAPVLVGAPRQVTRGAPRPEGKVGVDGWRGGWR